MTASLPQDVRDVFSRFITTEYTTVDSRGQPITWPVTPYYTDGGPVIDVTTGLGYPKKANDARTHPKVSLLFSDPTGSGLDAAPMVLVQGTAIVDDADLVRNRERYSREAAVKLPATRKMHPPKAVRGVFNWYYTRIYVHVRPERVFVWPQGDTAAEPAVHDTHMEEVRSGHSEEPPEPHAPPAGGGVAWDDRVHEIGARFPTAVLSALAPDGFPVSARLPVSLDEAARLIRFGAEPAGLPLDPGRACVTVHEHAPDFTWQYNFQVRGDLVRDERGPALVPHRLVGGFLVPPGPVARYREFMTKGRRFRRTAKRELRRRDERLRAGGGARG